MAIDAIGLRERGEAAVSLADRLRAAQEQHAALAQREMEHGDDFRLRLRAQIDQQIAAGHEIERENGGSTSRS